VQRIFLHLHLESGLDSLIYIFDEPLAGLHPSEKQSMIEAVQELRDIGNTVIVVEHDREMLLHADHYQNADTNMEAHLPMDLNRKTVSY